jgi:hypothetical protein
MTKEEAMSQYAGLLDASDAKWEEHECLKAFKE